jgi:23S rRNA pseudouridine1911/1915/1917 synthase
MRLVEHLGSVGLAGKAARAALESGKVWYKDAPTADAGRDVDPAHVRVLPSAPRLVVGRDPAIVWKDEHLVIVWKPPGILSVPAPGRRGDRSLTGSIAHILDERLFPVHRLDELTSGLMVIARSERAQNRLREMFAAHTVERRYFVIVRGVFPREPATLRSNLVRNRGDGLRGVAHEEEDYDETTREAVTHVSLIEPLGPTASLLEARLETGRTHQVRIQLADAGHPVLGDDLYGGEAVARALRGRYALHAYVLGFRHPFTQRDLRWEAPLADDLERLARRLRDR